MTKKDKQKLIDGIEDAVIQLKIHKYNFDKFPGLLIDLETLANNADEFIGAHFPA